VKDATRKVYQVFHHRREQHGRRHSITAGSRRVIVRRVRWPRFGTTPCPAPRVR
jgi:hypothetical protein